MRKYDEDFPEDFPGDDVDFPEKEEEKKKIFGVSRGIFAALASESLLIIVLTAVVILLLAGRNGGGGGGGNSGRSSGVESGAESGEAQGAAEQSFAVAAHTRKAPSLVGRIWGDELKEEFGDIDFSVMPDPDSKEPKGSVTKQNPRAGATLYSGEDGRCKMEITVSSSEFSDKYSSLVGKTPEEAMSLLEGWGVKKADVFRKYAVSVSGVGDGRVSAFACKDGREVKEGEKLKAGDAFVMTINSYAHSVTVPLLCGKSFESAAEALYKSELNIGEVSYKESGMADGTVLSQMPAEQETAYCGDSVDLVLSRRGDAFPMPSLLGMTLEDARACLERHGLELGTVDEASSREYEAGAVCAQSVAESADVYAAAVIDISLAVGGKADGSVEDWNAEALVIDISENAHLSAGTVEKLAARGEGTSACAKCDAYAWTLPVGLRYPEGDAGLDLSLSINSGEFYSKAASLLAKEGYEATDFSVFAYTNGQELPEGLGLSIDLGASFRGASVRLLFLNEAEDAFLSFSDEVCEVGEDGFLDFEPGRAKVYAAVREVSLFHTVDVLYDEDEVACRECRAGASFPVEAGGKVTLHIEAKDGFLLQSVAIDGVKLEGVAGRSAFVYTLPSVESDLVFEIAAQRDTGGGED